MPAPHALHGDGINFAFFNLLWSKSEDRFGSRGVAENAPLAAIDDPLDSRRQVGSTKSNRGGKPNPIILRVPDTVIFLFGQPHQWYFTSNNGGPDRDKTTILRKRRSNLTLANIEEVFLNKAGEVGEDDVVAYFIGNSEENDMEGRTSDHLCSGEGIGNEALSYIEYFNKKSLQEFLQFQRNNKSGILQRFVAPHGGIHNSHIRAVWTPKLCILDRRRTKQDLHDARFALCERCTTFDGPDIYSVSLPLQGTVLAKRVEGICKEIVRHVADVITKENRESSRGTSSISRKNFTNNTFLNVARLVVDFKVDGNGRIWILWSNSIRIQSGSAENRMNLTEPILHEIEPLNMDKLVRLPSSIKLTQVPNHNTSLKLENKLSSTTCPSCNKYDIITNFRQVSYKIIIQHYEKTLEVLNGSHDSYPSNKWPPHDRFIKAVGNVGFGPLPKQIALDRETHPSLIHSKETLAIPPIIRELHPKLQVNGYNIYRQDPLFLLKTADVCEPCYLSFAEMASTSFTHVTQPIKLFDSDKRVQPADSNDEKKRASDRRKNDTTQPSKTHQVSFIEFGIQPEFPMAIMEPPLVRTQHSDSDTLPTSKDTIVDIISTHIRNNVCVQKSIGHVDDDTPSVGDCEDGVEIQVEALSKNPYDDKTDET